MQRLTRIPERVLIDEMDRARRREEDARRDHDRMARELGFERVRVRDLAAGDIVRQVERGTAKELLVEATEYRTDAVCSWWNVTLKDEDHGSHVRTFDEQDDPFVSRIVDYSTEAF